MRQKLAGLVGEINQYRTRLEKGEGSALGAFRIHDRRHAIVGTDLQTFRTELIPPADICWNDLILESSFFQEYRDFLPVRCRPIVKFDYV